MNNSFEFDFVLAEVGDYGRINKRHTSEVYLKRSNKNSHQYSQAVITADIVKEAGLKAGDRINWLKTRDNKVQAFRVNNGTTVNGKKTIGTFILRDYGGGSLTICDRKLASDIRCTSAANGMDFADSFSAEVINGDVIFKRKD